MKNMAVLGKILVLEFTKKVIVQIYPLLREMKTKGEKKRLIILIAFLVIDAKCVIMR